MEGEAMYTVEEVARRLKLNQETIRRWLRDGKLRGIRLGSNRAGYRIPESELRRLFGGHLPVEEPSFHAGQEIYIRDSITGGTKGSGTVIKVLTGPPYVYLVTVRQSAKSGDAGRLVPWGHDAVGPEREPIAREEELRQDELLPWP